MLVAGESKTVDPMAFVTVQANAEKIVHQTIRDIGYTSKENGIDPDNCEVRIAFNHQSTQINQGVDQTDDEIGAGDHGYVRICLR